MFCKCGKPQYHWSHNTAHPCVRVQPEAHEFIPVSAPEVTFHEDNEFNNVNPSLDDIFYDVV